MSFNSTHLSYYVTGKADLSASRWCKSFLLILKTSNLEFLRKLNEIIQNQICLIIFLIELGKVTTFWTLLSEIFDG